MQSMATRYGNTKFRVHLFGVLVIWIIVCITCSEGNTIKERLPETSLLTNFVQRFIQPYIQSLQFAAEGPTLRSFNLSPVNKAISQVIEELRPYLQDDDNDKEYKAAKGGSSETTIIEFLPKPHHSSLRTKKEPSSELQSSILKYEKMKSEIKEALEREQVEENTKKMVARTLDDLIAQVIGNQCTWKSVDHSLAVFRNGKDVKHNITLQEWEDLKSQYLKFLENKQKDKSLALFNDFHKFFSKVINDTETLSKRYKIKCQLIKVDEDDSTARGKETERALDSCDDFVICSDELKEFLIDFYKSLNDTTVSVFRNYAAMYVRDVVSDDGDSEEIDSVPSVLDNMGHHIERRVSKVFIQEVGKLKLDENKKKETNIKILREFIRVTCKRVQKHLKKHLATDLSSLRARLLLTVKQDLNMNLGLDLGNLEADMKGRVCTVFVICNGRVSSRRASTDLGKPRLNSNSVYVKVQLSLDDKLKNAIVRNAKAFQNSVTSGNLQKYMSNWQNGFNMAYRRSDTNVTRTSVRVESTTQKLESNASSVGYDISKNSVLEMYK